MKNITTVLLLICTFIHAKAQQAGPSVYGQAGKRTLTEILKVFHQPDTNAVLVIAHRGDWRQYPENSLQGILSAADMGVDMVEIDLQKTSDGVLVLMHDATVDRVTNGKGLVSSYTLGLAQETILEKWIRPAYHFPYTHF